jgi:hypothetical protein
MEAEIPESLSPWERVAEGRVRANAQPGACAGRGAAEVRVRVDAPPSAEAPEAADTPAEDEAIRAAYQARLQRVVERMEQDVPNNAIELEPAGRDYPPPEAVGQAPGREGPIEEDRRGPE